jgi:hypothetical protein
MTGVATNAARRSITWALCLVGIVLGSVAWSAWVFLNTWADPSTTERVTEAVLADPEARDEVLAPVRDQVRSMIPAEAGVSDAQIDAALDSVLADPAARDRVADAFVGPGGSVRIAEARTAFGDEIARRQPELAPIVQASPPQLRLPDLSFADRARDLARASVIWLALASIGAFGLSTIFGDPRRTARRFGVWAASMGLVWVAGPPIAARLARAATSSLDATVDVVVHAYARPILLPAIALTIAGALAVVVSFAPSTTRTISASARTAPRSAPAARRGGGWQTSVASAPVRPSVPGPRTAPAPRPTDTQEMPVQMRPAPHGDGRPPADDATPESLPATRSPHDRPSPSDDTGEVDVWAAYESH